VKRKTQVTKMTWKQGSGNTQNEAENEHEKDLLELVGIGLMIGDQNDSQIMLDWALLLAAT